MCPLEGWFIPADSEFGRFGGFEVNFLPTYRRLHDAGYNVLTYDIRNHGMSASGNGGICTTAVAWAKHPSEFAEIQALILLQPLDGRSIGEQFSNLMGFEGGYDRLDRAVHERTGFHLEEESRWWRRCTTTS